MKLVDKPYRIKYKSFFIKKYKFFFIKIVKKF